MVTKFRRRAARDARLAPSFFGAAAFGASSQIQVPDTAVNGCPRRGWIHRDMKISLHWRSNPSVRQGSAGLSWGWQSSIWLSRIPGEVALSGTGPGGCLPAPLGECAPGVGRPRGSRPGRARDRPGPIVITIGKWPLIWSRPVSSSLSQAAGRPAGPPAGPWQWQQPPVGPGAALACRLASVGVGPVAGVQRTSVALRLQAYTAIPPILSQQSLETDRRRPCGKKRDPETARDDRAMELWRPILGVRRSRILSRISDE
jgi:hypothetical protein